MTNRHSIATVVGRNKEAAKTANNQPMVFTEIALGDGNRFPSGGETSLENEVHRGVITASGVESAEPNAVWFDLYVPANVGTFYAQEIGLFDEDNLLYAVSRFDQPVPKFGPDSSSLSDNTFRIVVVFSDTENVIAQTSPVAGLTGENLPQHLPFATDPEAANTETLGKIMQVNQAHSLFSLHHDETITGDNTEESPLSVRAAGIEAGIVSLDEIDNRFIALIRNNPTFPEIATPDHRLALTASAGGNIEVDINQSWIWRGLIRFWSNSFLDEDRSFTTEPNKTYHLRWNAPGTWSAIPETDWPKGRFVLIDLTGVNPPEADPVYDTTYDQMLIARIVTDGNNNATVTTLLNAVEHSTRITFEIPHNVQLTYEDATLPDDVSNLKIATVNCARPLFTQLIASTDWNLQTPTGSYTGEINMGAKTISRYEIAGYLQGSSGGIGGAWITIEGRY